MSYFPTRISSVLWAVLLCWAAHAQQNDIPLSREIYQDLDRNGAAKGSTMHTGLRPIIESRADLHNVLGYRRDSVPQYYWITAKLFKEHLVEVREGGFHLTIDPAFRFELGKDLREGSEYADNTLLQQNSRGFRLAADLGPTVSFQSMFMENQATPPGYLFGYTQQHGVMPGQGRIKAFNTRGLDFAWAAGNVSWTPRPWINAQLGRGKHFVGNGYRSVLLSDNANPYPYVKLSALTNNRRIQYTAIFAKLQHVGVADRLPTGEAGESLFWWKRATFLHASINLGPLQLAVFEGTMWKTIDTSGVMPFNAMEINPVIGLNTAVNGFDGRNTQLLGLDAKYRVTDKLFVYGQFALTDPGEGRHAWQAGFQVFDIFRHDLHLLAEYNQATPFAYTKGDPRMSWTHDNQPLASPIGTDFSEVVVRADLGILRRIRLQGELSLLTHPWGLNMTDVAGADIFGPPRGTGAAGWYRDRLFAGFFASYRLNQMSNMQLTLGYSMRDLRPGPTGQDSGYLHVAFHTGLFNRYYDI